MSIIGTIVIAIVHIGNLEKEEALLEHGVRADAMITGKSVERKRRGGSRMGGHVMSTHFVEFKVMANGEPMFPNLADYFKFDKPKKKKEEPKFDAEVIRAQRVVSEDVYEAAFVGKRIKVIYLPEDPETIELVNEEGGINLPQLQIFGFVTSAMIILTIANLLYYRKKGKTF